jgi:hypothetical protein
VLAFDSPDTGNHVFCYCEDCQAFARFLERTDVLDAAGGTRIFQISPASVRITEGADQLLCLRLSEKGLFRWYAGCCNTPIGNTLGAKVPFVGLIAAFIDASGAGVTYDELLGPSRGGFHGRSAVGGVPAGAHPGVPLGALLRIARLMGSWWITGKGSPSPFFDAKTGSPRSPPRVLAAAEREALRGPSERAG